MAHGKTKPHKVRRHFVPIVEIKAIIGATDKKGYII